jgi:hypothetical protein
MSAQFAFYQQTPSVSVELQQDTYVRGQLKPVGTQRRLKQGVYLAQALQAEYEDAYQEPDEKAYLWSNRVQSCCRQIVLKRATRPSQSTAER